MRPRTLEEFAGQINDSVAEMNKIGWKVGVGLDLTEEEKTAFKDSAKQYIDSTTKLLEQQQYTVNLAIDTMLSPGTTAYANISKFTTEFYGKTREELERLGTEYSKAVNEAFADGVLTEDENLNLETIQNRIQELIDKVSSAKYKGTLKAIELQAADAAVEPESFQALQEKIDEELKGLLNDAHKDYVLAVEHVELLYSEGFIDDKQRDEMLAEINKNFNREQGDIVLEGLGVEVRNIQANYKDEVDQFENELNSSINGAISKAIRANSNGEQWGYLWSDLEAAVFYSHQKIDLASEQAIEVILGHMQPTTEDLENIADSFKKLGQVPPENITKGLLDAYQLEALTGGTDHMYEILADRVANSPEARKAVKYAVESGNQIPEELARALRSNYGLVYNSSTGVFDQVQKPVPTKAQEAKELMKDAGLDISASLAESLASKGTTVQQKTIELLERIKKGESLKETEIKALLANLGVQSADALSKSLESKKPEVQQSSVQLLSQISGGVQLKSSEIKTLLGNLGIDASDKMISALAEKKPETQEQAVELMDQLIQADAKKRPEILAQLFDLGVAVDNSLGKGLYDNYQFVKSKTEGVIDVIDSTTNTKITEITPEFAARLRDMGVTGFEALDEMLKNAKISAPEIDPLSQTDANDWKNDAMKKLKMDPIRLGLELVANAGTSGIQGHATGGIFSTPHIAAFAEDGPEAVVPLSPSRRSSALDIWGEAGRMLGVSDDVFNVLAPKGKTTMIDYDLLAAKLAAELRRAPLKADVSATIHNEMSVNLDEEIVGRKTAPVISRILSRY